MKHERFLTNRLSSAHERTHKLAKKFENIGRWLQSVIQIARIHCSTGCLPCGALGLCPALNEGAQLQQTKNTIWDFPETLDISHFHSTMVASPDPSAEPAPKRNEQTIQHTVTTARQYGARNTTQQRRRPRTPMPHSSGQLFVAPTLQSGSTKRRRHLRILQLRLWWRPASPLFVEGQQSSASHAQFPHGIGIWFGQLSLQYEAVAKLSSTTGTAISCRTARTVGASVSELSYVSDPSSYLAA